MELIFQSLSGRVYVNQRVIIGLFLGTPDTVTPPGLAVLAASAVAQADPADQSWVNGSAGIWDNVNPGFINPKRLLNWEGII